MGGCDSDFFEASGGGDPTFQNFMWFFGHPEVYLSLLPFLLALGLAILVVVRRQVKKHSVSLLFVLSAFVLAFAGLKAGQAMYGAGIDTALHDTYYVIAHLQWVGMFALSFIVLAFAYFFFRRFVGVAYRRSIAALHWGLYSAGIALVFAPTLLLISNQGMPQRYADYEQSFDVWNGVSHIGYIVTLISAGIFAICLIEGISRRIRHGKEPDALDT